MWECGLKSVARGGYHGLYIVTPCVGVWIEIYRIKRLNGEVLDVTPCVGVWIEIIFRFGACIEKKRHSLCGSVD